MGREAEAEVRFGGAAARARLLLEADALILRGGLKARLPRASLGSAMARDGVLRIETAEGVLEADLGAAAEAWAKAVATPPPGLADKLGLRADRRVVVLGALTGPELLAAVDPWRAEAAGAAMALAELPDAATFGAVWPVAEALALPFWGVTRKGKGAAFPEADLRAALRAAGWIDSKTCAVSADWTATRFGLRR
jgi:hypothetical protein